MDNKKIKRQINKYLDFSLIPNPHETKPPTDNYPFELEYAGKIGDTLYYIFDSGFELQYACWEPGFIGNFPMADMTMEDLADEDLGLDWIKKKRPVSLYPERYSSDGPKPSDMTGRQIIENMARDALGPAAEFEVLEGEFLKRTGHHLALIQPKDAEYALVLGTNFDKPLRIAHREATSDRRTALAIARHLGLRQQKKS